MSKCRKLTGKELQLISDTFYTQAGLLFYKDGQRFKNRQVGKDQTKGRHTVAWCGGKAYPVHRIVYYLYYGSWPKGVVDHINGNPKDNRPENLRDVTQSMNCRSFFPSHKDSTSVFRGVYWYERKGKWHSQIMSQGKRYNVGYFESEYEAALAWNIKAQELGFNPESFNKVFDY